MKRKYFALPYIAWMLVLILAPMILIVYYAFTNQIDGKTIFTFENIAKAFEPIFLQVLTHSIWIALVSTVFCLLIGYPVAYILSRMKARAAAIASVLFILPMWMNFLLRTYAWMALLDVNGLINRLLTTLGLGRVQLLYTQGAVIAGMVYNFLPFMILPIYSVLIKISRSHVEAAQDLGASARQVFQKVIFPLSMPGVITGITMVFVPSITTFAISRLLGGAQFMLFGDLIENQFMLVQDRNFGSALSLIMLALVLLSLMITKKYETEDTAGKLW